MLTRSIFLVAAAAATLGPHSAEAADYVFRAKPVAIASASPSTPPAPPVVQEPMPPEPPVAETPRPPVASLVLSAATTYRTSRPLTAILAELAPTVTRAISLSSFDRARTGTLSWEPSDSPILVATYISNSLGFLSVGATASLDPSGHLTLYVVQAKANVTLKSSSGIALGAFAFAPLS